MHILSLLSIVFELDTEPISAIMQMPSRHAIKIQKECLHVFFRSACFQSSGTKCVPIAKSAESVLTSFPADEPRCTGYPQIWSVTAFLGFSFRNMKLDWGTVARLSVALAFFLVIPLSGGAIEQLVRSSGHIGTEFTLVHCCRKHRQNWRHPDVDSFVHHVDRFCTLR